MDSTIFTTFIIVFGACFIASGIILGFWLAVLNSMLHFAKTIIEERTLPSPKDEKNPVEGTANRQL